MYEFMIQSVRFSVHAYIDIKLCVIFHHDKAATFIWLLMRGCFCFCAFDTKLQNDACILLKIELKLFIEFEKCKFSFSYLLFREVYLRQKQTPSGEMASIYQFPDTTKFRDYHDSCWFITLFIFHKTIFGLIWYSATPKMPIQFNKNGFYFCFYLHMKSCVSLYVCMPPFLSWYHKQIHKNTWTYLCVIIFIKHYIDLIAINI